MAIRACMGLASFPEEQILAISLKKTGLDLDHLRKRKTSQVEQIKGLSIWEGKETFANLAGLANIKSFTGKLIGGRDPLGAVFFMDELEKMVAGEGDTSGVSQAMNEAFLTWSQNSRALGIIFVGVPGAGKTATAKAVAGEAGVPCLMGSLSGVKSPHVGESESNVRNMFKTVDAIAAGSRVLMLATCNRISAITPEMRARFRLGTFFYNFPDEEENAALWSMFRAKYGIADQNIPESSNWVGREIESCCELAYLLTTTLTEAAKFIVPVAVSAADQIDTLRRQASGRFLSASYPGVFKVDSQFVAPAPQFQAGARKMDLN